MGCGTCGKLAFLAFAADLCLWGVAGGAGAQERARAVSIQEARQLLAAAPESKPRCILRGVATVPTGVIVSQTSAFYFQDETGGIAASSRQIVSLASGDRVEVEGRLRYFDDLEPEIEASRVSRLGPGPPVACIVTLRRSVRQKTADIRLPLEALEAVAGSRFDLILMDLQMPELDGFQTKPFKPAELFAAIERLRPDGYRCS